MSGNAHHPESENDQMDTLQLNKERDHLCNSIQQTQQLAMSSFQAFQVLSHRTTQVFSDLQEKNNHLLQQLKSSEVERTTCLRTITERDDEIKKLSRDNEIFRSTILEQDQDMDKIKDELGEIKKKESALIQLEARERVFLVVQRRAEEELKIRTDTCRQKERAVNTHQSSVEEDKRRLLDAMDNLKEREIEYKEKATLLSDQEKLFSEKTSKFHEDSKNMKLLRAEVERRATTLLQMEKEYTPKKDELSSLSDNVNTRLADVTRREDILRQRWGGFEDQLCAIDPFLTEMDEKRQERPANNNKLNFASSKDANLSREVWNALQKSKVAIVDLIKTYKARYEDNEAKNNAIESAAVCGSTIFNTDPKMDTRKHTTPPGASRFCLSIGMDCKRDAQEKYFGEYLEGSSTSAKAGSTHALREDSDNNNFSKACDYQQREMRIEKVVGANHMNKAKSDSDIICIKNRYMFQVASAAKSHSSLVRGEKAPACDDAMAVTDNIAVICDGIGAGGAKSGEVARSVTEKIVTTFSELTEKDYQTMQATQVEKLMTASLDGFLDGLAKKQDKDSIKGSTTMSLICPFKCQDGVLFSHFTVGDSQVAIMVQNPVDNTWMCHFLSEPKYYLYTSMRDNSQNIPLQVGSHHNLSKVVLKGKDVFGTTLVPRALDQMPEVMVIMGSDGLWDNLCLGRGKFSEADKKTALEGILNHSNDPGRSGWNQGVEDPKLTREAIVGAMLRERTWRVLNSNEHQGKMDDISIITLSVGPGRWTVYKPKAYDVVFRTPHTPASSIRKGMEIHDGTDFKMFLSKVYWPIDLERRPDLSEFNTNYLFRGLKDMMCKFDHRCIFRDKCLYGHTNDDKRCLEFTKYGFCTKEHCSELHTVPLMEDAKRIIAEFKEGAGLGKRRPSRWDRRTVEPGDQHSLGRSHYSDKRPRTYLGKRSVERTARRDYGRLRD
tara:strand:+ start:19561 stop:22404 length:2844 start_codon:yes stop_codon:yes gene_type:complete